MFWVGYHHSSRLSFEMVMAWEVASVTVAVAMTRIAQFDSVWLFGHVFESIVWFILSIAAPHTDLQFRWKMTHVWRAKMICKMMSFPYAARTYLLFTLLPVQHISKSWKNADEFMNQPQKNHQISIHLCACSFEFVKIEHKCIWSILTLVLLVSDPRCYWKSCIPSRK